MVRTRSQATRTEVLLHRLRQVRDPQPGEKSLQARLKHCAALLEKSHQDLARLSSSGSALSSAAVWLLDNYFVIREQVRVASREVRGKYENDLPRLDDSAGGTLPRVYHLAQKLVTHFDHKLDAVGVREFVNDYQGRSFLTLAEVWAVAAMLRLALIEKLSELAAEVAGPTTTARQDGRQERNGADDAAAEEPGLERNRVLIANAIASLRALGLMDWKEFVESTSVVERILRRDPSGVYGQMTFDSRSRYQGVVAGLACRSTLTEEQVARVAVECAQRYSETPDASSAGSDASPEVTQRHVGYYLLGEGRSVVEERIGYHPAPRETIRRFVARRRGGFYLGGMLGLWLLLTGGTVVMAWQMGALEAAGPLGFFLLILLAAAAVGHLAVTLVDWLCSLAVAPQLMVRMDFSTGIPADCRTLVAVPTFLNDERGISALLRQLELRFLANRDENLLFALITDFPDADRETLPEDSILLAKARQGIEHFNRRYAKAFYLLHRPRTWNAQEGIWMGRERKRGKLTAMNRLLRSGDASAFQVTVGDLARLATVRFVITLDTDTRLPQDAGRELVACMAHPLNRPWIDPKTHVVTAGHAVLQPRVTTTVVDAHRSLFSQLLAGDAGIDPYTRQTSNAYQDVFDEGSFIGKGIYDVRAWEVAVEKRFPDNRVLSHDLIEGCFARSGFVGDVELFESVPSRVLADASRRHRWIRGDWQIASWILRQVPFAGGRAENPLSRLSRWKIADNLRRSLTPVFLLALLLLGWTLTPTLATFWTLLAATIVFGPFVLGTAHSAVRKFEDKPWQLHLVDEARTCGRALAAEVLCWCILPYTAHYHGDAIVRALYRMLVSRHLLLEWTTASDAEVRSRASCRDHYEIMWACTIAPVGMAALLLAWNPGALWLAGPVLLMWLLGPALAWAVSQPSASNAPRLTAEERLRLGRWARQTWHYFEVNTGPQTHWLPPDNLQERPHPVTASRTSPTNIGMGMLADLAAWDLGYLPPSAMLDRSAHTLHSLLHLEQYRGHFYNWYDTSTLQPLEPRYVSSVDSGNLWAALIVLHAGVGEMRDRPLVPPRLVDGMRETLAVIASLGATLQHSSRGRQFEQRLVQCQTYCDRAVTGKARDACKFINQLHRRATQMVAIASAEHPLLSEWTQTLERQCAAVQRDLCELAFWTRIPALDTEKRRWGDRRDIEALSVRQREKLQELFAAIDTMDGECTLDQLPAFATRVAQDAEAILPTAPSSTDGFLPRRYEVMLSRIAAAARHAAVVADAQLRQIARVQDLCQQFGAMDFRFLYDAQRKLLAIGYNATDHRRDDVCYDLFASEARMTSFLAVSYGQLPREHWFAMGRIVTLASGKPALVSWSGSLFEYLMPTLIMPSYGRTLLDMSCRAAVRHQIRYARRQGIPWGISESAYNETNPDLAYRYRAFGVPGLGLERGLGKNLVVTPYASALALEIAPREAIENLTLLERLGCLGSWGFYDALDYTPGRDTAGEPAMCRIVMAHHSGMTLLALTNVLLGMSMQRRFFSDGPCEAHDLLLQERLPKAIRPVNPEALDVTAPAMEARASFREGRRHAMAPVVSNASQATQVAPVGYGVAETAGEAAERFSNGE